MRRGELCSLNKLRSQKRLALKNQKLCTYDYKRKLEEYLPLCIRHVRIFKSTHFRFYLVKPTNL